jgi:hypothetical protein
VLGGHDKHLLMWKHKTKTLVCLLSIGILSNVVAIGAENMTAASDPPVVVKTVPENGSTGVDAKTTAIRVTFSKDMMDNSWSWCVDSRMEFPKRSGKPGYDKDKRTCVYPVSLEPGKKYATWVNSASHKNFKDTEGQSAVPYLLIFETKK